MSSASGEKKTRRAGGGAKALRAGGGATILRGMKRWCILAGAVAALAGGARADSRTGTAWAVRFNRPDQNTFPSTARAEEYVIREAFLARLAALQSNDWGCLATYTFSGASSNTGAAGPILAAMSNALARGAKLGFVADDGVNTASNWWPGTSLAGLAARPGNALELARAPSDAGLMHDKLGVFWSAAATQAWVLSGSWNFTGGASTYQWNILVELQDNALGAACSNELREMLSGRFHADPAKSHAHDGARFRLAGTDRDGWVRFAPYPDGAPGGSNALTDIVAAIDGATDRIVFALNKLTRPDVAAALIRACDRGVAVHGTIPKSDRATTNDDSWAMWTMLGEPTNYATANRAWLYDAYATAERTAYDAGETDLTHTKYLVIDPEGPAPLVIHGSANWTEAALVDTGLNDENVLFLPHGEIARAFAAQFDAMTDGTVPRCVPGGGGTGALARLDVWLPDARTYELVHTTNLLAGLAAWTNRTQGLPAGRGFQALALTNEAERRFFRVRSAP